MRGRTRSATWHASSRVGTGHVNVLRQWHPRSTQCSSTTKQQAGAKQSKAKQSRAKSCLVLTWGLAGALHISQAFMPKHDKFSPVERQIRTGTHLCGRIFFLAFPSISHAVYLRGMHEVSISVSESESPPPRCGLHHCPARERTMAAFPPPSGLAWKLV